MHLSKCLAPTGTSFRTNVPSVAVVACTIGLPESASPHFAHVTPWEKGCTAELEDRQGRKVLLRWVSAPGPELLGVVRAFWGQAA